MITSSTLTSSGHQLDLSPNSFGELRRSSYVPGQEAVLKRNLDQDGYLYIPGFFPRDEVLAVREEFIRRLQRKGSLDPQHPKDEMVASPEPRNPSRQEILDGNTLLPGLVFSPRLMNFYAELLGGPVRAYDHIWVRLIRPGKGTQPHCDLPYMGRGTRNVMTAWIPYRDTSLEVGGLMMLEKSHTQSDRIRNYLESDVDTYCANRGPYKHKSGLLSNNPATLREKLGGRWLTAEFQAGDLLTFGMSTIHASLDNRTTSYRISTDTRYQLASEPIDPRWVGPDTEEYAEKNRIGKIC
ncbi:MAG: phytanoyl-CoA dioxygenase family protein [Terrimicrobiaceae bacterium]